MKRLLLVLLIAVLAVFYQPIFTWCFFKFTALTAKPEVAPPPKATMFTVAASNYPAAYFARRIGGDHLRVTCPLPPMVDPAFWMPASADIHAFRDADLMIFNGAGFEQWTNAYPMPENKTLSLAETFKDQWLAADPNGHTWLDPLQAVKQAETLRDALAAHDPQNGPIYAANCAALRRDLQALDATLRALPIHEVLAVGSGYHYLARRYGWSVTVVDLDPAQPPTPAQMAQLRAVVKVHPNAHVLLWETQPFTESELQAQKVGLSNVVFNPCANLDEKDGDYLAVMKQNVDRLKEAVQK